MVDFFWPILLVHVSDSVCLIYEINRQQIILYLVFNVFLLINIYSFLVIFTFPINILNIIQDVELSISLVSF